MRKENLAMVKGKPTVKELEKILNGPELPIRVLPNGEIRAGEERRAPMSILVKPELQKRLKVCASGLGVSRSALIEWLVLQGLPDKEQQAFGGEKP